MGQRRRILIGVGCLLLVGGLCIHYGAHMEAAWPYPTGEQVATTPGNWDGTSVLLFGVVEQTDPEAGTITMRVETDTGETAQRVTVHGAGDTADRVTTGGVIQVFGPLAEQGTRQEATRVVVVDQSPSDRLYKLVTSLVGGLLAVGLALRYWRIDWQALGIRRRDRNG